MEQHKTVDKYITQYRPTLSDEEISHVHHTQEGVGDNADLIQVRLNLPWDNDQWPLLTFTKNDQQVEVIVYQN